MHAEIDRRKDAGRRPVRLEARAGRPDVFAQGGDVGAIGPDAAGVDRQTQGLGLFDTKAGIIELGEAVAFDGHEAVSLRTIERARRALHARALRHDIEEIIPIPTVPHRSLSSSVRSMAPDWMRRERFSIATISATVQIPDRAGACQILTPPAFESRGSAWHLSIRLVHFRHHWDGPCAKRVPGRHVGTRYGLPLL